MIKQHCFSLPLLDSRNCLSSGVESIKAQEKPGLCAAEVRANLSQEPMGVLSSLPLPAAESDRAEGTPCHPAGHTLLWTALLFLGESGCPGGAEELEQGQVHRPNSAAATLAVTELGQG